MKINKLLIAAIAATTMFASCSKEDVSGENPNKVLTISLTNPATANTHTGKAIGPAGGRNLATINDGDGIIFILDASDNVKQAIVFAPTFPSNAQAVTNVAVSDKVYVLANIGDINKGAWTGASKPTNLAALKLLSMGIADPIYGQVYTKATIANATGLPVAITHVAGESTATVSVAVKPAYARIELGKVVAKTGGTSTITDFTVSGVYVDEYYPQYTMGLLYAGTLSEQLVNTATFDQIPAMKNEGTWAAVSKEATAGGTNKWVYNVPAGNMPRLIIKLTNVSGTWNGQTLTNAVGPYFLTIKDYSPATTAFVAGNIYDIAKIEFDQTNLGVTPNAKMVTLTVTITNTPWDIKDLAANLM